MPRRNRIILEQRERIIQAFENTNEDYLMVADTIGVNRSTARSIVARYVREGRIAERPRGGPKCKVSLPYLTLPSSKLCGISFVPYRTLIRF